MSKVNFSRWPLSQPRLKNKKVLIYPRFSKLHALQTTPALTSLLMNTDMNTSIFRCEYRTWRRQEKVMRDFVRRFWSSWNFVSDFIYQSEFTIL